MWKEVPRTRKKEVLSSHHVESSRPSLTTVSLEVLYLVNCCSCDGRVLGESNVFIGIHDSFYCCLHSVEAHYSVPAVVQPGNSFTLYRTSYSRKTRIHYLTLLAVVQPGKSDLHRGQ